jgi:hypothetical protein
MSKAEFIWFVVGLLLGAGIMLFVFWLGERIDCQEIEK